MGSLYERRWVKSCLASAKDTEKGGGEEREAEAWGKRPGDLGSWVATVISTITGQCLVFKPTMCQALSEGLLVVVETEAQRGEVTGWWVTDMEVPSSLSFALSKGTGGEQWGDKMD